MEVIDILMIVTLGVSLVDLALFGCAGAENPDVKKAARSGGGKENSWARKALRSSPRMLWGA